MTRAQRGTLAEVPVFRTVHPPSLAENSSWSSPDPSGDAPPDLVLLYLSVNYSNSTHITTIFDLSASALSCRQVDR